MTMPNFLIIGAMKSGTTALYYYLEQHPQIYMSPVKEPNFFAFEGERMDARLPGDPKGINRSSVTDIEEYRLLFSRASDEKALGEASHWYLYSSKAVERISYYTPDIRIIAVLRNPVERAYSHFLHSFRTQTEPLDNFARALEEEERGLRNQAHSEDYVGRGFYSRQLKRYYETFDPSQIRVYLQEDLNTAPVETLQDIFRFLEVDKTFVPHISLKHNVSGLPKSKLLDNLLRRPHAIKRTLKLYMPAGMKRRLSRTFDALKTRNLAAPPPLNPEVRRQLIEVYREDILELQNLIGRDLSRWLQ